MKVVRFRSHVYSSSFRYQNGIKKWELWNFTRLGGDGIPIMELVTTQEKGKIPKNDLSYSTPILITRIGSLLVP